ncbi:MAG TPA: hypothetical protein VI776_14905 [Anaerolineales bacterium]|jgi:hypothetical protein|nr:hypothetical protein [Anaerolineales bacterium]
MLRFSSVVFWLLVLLVVLIGGFWFADQGEIPSGVLWALLALAVWWFSGRLASGRPPLDE